VGQRLSSETEIMLLCTAGGLPLLSSRSGLTNEGNESRVMVEAQLSSRLLNCSRSTGPTGDTYVGSLFLRSLYANPEPMRVKAL
jgi:hypothetical protein